MVILGKDVQEPSDYCTKPTDIKEVNLGDVQSYSCTYRRRSLVAYEHRHGSLFDMTDVKPEGFYDMIQYL
jgi:hypothetical protein